MSAAGLRAAIGGVLSLVVLGLLADPAAAHAGLESSTPAAGATVTELSRIDLRFSEGVEPAGSHVWLRDGAGYLELAAPTRLDGDPRALSVTVPPLGDGTYEVTWHSLATDGHAEQGTFSITLATSSAATTAVTLADPAADFPPDTSLAIAVDDISSLAPPPQTGHGHGPGDATTGLARGILDVSVAVLIGGLAFVVLVWPNGLRLLRTRQVIWGAAGVAAIASVELTAFQHAGATGTSTLAALMPGQLLEALDFRFGRVALARLLLLGVALALLAQLARRRASDAAAPWRWGVALVAVGLAETLVLLGHSSAAVSLDAAARLTHVVGISAWTGGLVMLLAVVLPRRRASELLGVLPRFSAFATAAIVVLVAGGSVLALDLLGSPGALLSSDYGRVLLAKLVVVALLLLAASLSRAHVQGCLRAAGDLSGAAIARPLAMWVGIEVALMAGIFAITAVLVGRVPPS